jgi:muconolactone delta-isomerase
MLPHETGLWKRARDMRAWHLLDFEDRDEIHSSLERRSGYPYRAPKRFRELTRHLVICVHNRDWRLQ